MKVIGAAILGMTLATPLAAVTAPAHAQDVMGQVQRFLNPNGDQQAYQRGREDQWRQQQAERDRRHEQWREAQRERGRQDQGYGDRGYYNDRPNYNQPYYNGR